MNTQLQEMGARVKALRVERGWSHERLAREIKMSKQTLVNLEAGVREPKFLTVVRIAEALGVPATDLVDEEHDGEGAA